MESVGLSVQEKKGKIDFHDGGHLGFPIGLSVQEKKRNIDFQDGGHLGFSIGMILAIFDLQVTRMLPSNFGVNWPFGSGEEAKNRFSRWQPSWISDRRDFSYF